MDDVQSVHRASRPGDGSSPFVKCTRCPDLMVLSIGQRQVHGGACIRSLCACHWRLGC